MNMILQDVSPQALIRAMEENIVAYACTIGGLPGVMLHESNDLVWILTDVPFPLFNFVGRARLKRENADEAIRAAIARCRSRGVPMFWSVDPETQPPDMRERLSAHGFTHTADVPGMAVDLAVLNDEQRRPRELEIRQVKDTASMEKFINLLGLVFQWPPFVMRAFADFSNRLGFGTDSPLRYYFGSINGEIVATSMLFLGSGVAGIYDVAVHPEMRRKGIGAAITLAPLVDAREEGYRVAILHATKMGFPLYKKLGFQEYCKFGNYVWIAEEQT